ncbi:SERine Proteinase INhibitor [Sarracenia purpurea var. burkii]
MTAEIPIKYHEDDELDAKIAEIPFKDERYTFTIVLPNKRDGITKLLKDLHHNALLRLFRETRDTTPDIDIKDVFTSKANLNGILEMNKPILVKDIFHNAKIELTEEGARAAAASGSHIVLLSASFTPEFKADHPFAYFIRDTHDSGFLFEGVLSSPDASSDPVTLLSVDNRNTFDNRPSTTIPTPPPGRSTTRKTGSSQRPNATSSQQQPQPQAAASRPNSNNQQPVANRINGNGNGNNQPQSASSPQNPTPRPIIGYQAPRPQEKGSVEYPIRQGE